MSNPSVYAAVPGIAKRFTTTVPFANTLPSARHCSLDVAEANVAITPSPKTAPDTATEVEATDDDENELGFHVALVAPRVNFPAAMLTVSEVLICPTYCALEFITCVPLSPARNPLVNMGLMGCTREPNVLFDESEPITSNSTTTATNPMRKYFNVFVMVFMPHSGSN